MTDLPQENVQTFPRPPALEPVPQCVRIWLGGSLIVSSTATLRVLETHHAPTYYIPRGAFDAALVDAPGRSFCEWKGMARYWTITANGTTAPRCAWEYPQPTRAFAGLAGHIAVYAHAMDRCAVGDVDVTPQPGNFYGGWVTPNLTGRIKGAPGTEGW